jgi:hypothetical protein
VGVVAVAIPIVIAIVAWSRFGSWMLAPTQPGATPQIAGAAATSSEAARAPRPATAAPTEARPVADATRPVPTRAATRAEPTPEVLQPEPTAETAQPPPTADVGRPWRTAVAPVPIAVGASTAVPEPAAATLADDPGAAVSTFYSLVSSHEFDSAAQLWSPRMRAAFPPATNLNQRFSQTVLVRLQRADVISQDQSQATVAVDLVELDGQSGQHHFVGNWYLVRGVGGWMLDQPQLTAAP